MPIWATGVDDFAKQVSERCDKIYTNLLASARPVLEHGTEAEES